MRLGGVATEALPLTPESEDARADPRAIDDGIIDSPGDMHHYINCLCLIGDIYHINCTVWLFNIHASLSLQAMFDAIAFLGTFSIVEAIQRTYQISGDSTDALEWVIPFFTTALGATIADNTVVTTDLITVDWMVDAAIANIAFLHVTDNRLKGLEIIRRITV